jgi:hypothetical protein
MKKIVTLLFTSFVVLLMFVGPGNVVKADENDEGHCECIVKPVYGAEKNKIVSNHLKSTEFKNVKREHLENGFNFLGAEYIQVLYNITEDVMMVGVPFIAEDGTVTMAVFFDGQYMDPDDLETPPAVD